MIAALLPFAGKLLDKFVADPEGKGWGRRVAEVQTSASSMLA